MNSEKIIVNSWNEWDPLKHVIVGKADNCCIPPAEPATDPKIPEDSGMKGMHGPRPQDTIDKANQQLDGLANILEKRGIKVDRPTPLDFNQKIARIIKGFEAAKTSTITSEYLRDSVFVTVATRNIVGGF